MENKIRAVIFDLGNVLIGFDHNIAVSKILRYTDKPKQEIYDLFFDSEITREFEKGNIAPLEFFERVKSSLKLKISYDEFLPIWNDIFFSNAGLEEFIGSLNSGLKLILLSNINQLHYEYILKNFSSLISLFREDSVILSYAAGFIKPAREIYELALLKAGVQKENTVYVDDRWDLVEAARSYGIPSIQFQGVDKLRGDFKELGIINKRNGIFQTK